MLHSDQTHIPRRLGAKDEWDRRAKEALDTTEEASCKRENIFYLNRL